MNNNDRIDLRPHGQGMYVLQVENDGRIEVQKVAY
jgi:hypothetical protein